MSNNLLDHLEIDLSGVKTGPYGGRLDHEPSQPDARRASFQPVDTDDPEILGLHNATDWHDTSVGGIYKEQGWHRMAAYLILEGKDNKEVARIAQVNPATISHLRAQRWFQELLSRLAADDHQAVHAAMQSHALAAVEKVAFLMENSESDRVQAQCALALIEHTQGKPVQRIHSVHEKGRTFGSPQEERDSLMQQLSELRRAREGTADVAVETADTSALGANVSQ